MNVRAGTLDNTTWLTPVAHIFTRSAQGWIAPADGAECHDTSPTDYLALAERWRVMWPEFSRPQ
jgi:hypothetical protein